MKPLARHITATYENSNIDGGNLAALYEFMIEAFESHTFHIDGYCVETAEDLRQLDHPKKISFSASGKGKDAYVFLNKDAERTEVGIRDDQDKDSLAFMQMAQTALERSGSELKEKYADFRGERKRVFPPASAAENPSRPLALPQEPVPERSPKPAGSTVRQFLSRLAEQTVVKLIVEIVAAFTGFKK